MASTIPPTILLTRPRKASERFAAGLGAPVIISPLTETRWLDPGPMPIAPDGLVFTSARGVEGFARLQSWRGPAFCVGDRTAQEARAAGFSATSAQGAVTELADLLETQAQGMKLLHPRGVDVAGDLRAHAVPYVVYSQEPCPLSAEGRACLLSGGVVIVPLFSPKAAVRFAQALPEQASTELRPVAMSYSVAKALEAQGITVTKIAASPNAQSMRAAISEALT
ncbi:uroporphyrinogen-III synthase [Litoreibacter ponti]|nr:uroporphyrinogen-III synthase [Litoreibacter ponti]